MSSPFVWLFDDLAIVMPEVTTSLTPDKRRKDFSFDAYRRNAKGKVKLDIRFKGTHSGRITNNRCYPGMMMMNSLHTWTHPYQKPITSRHPSQGMFSGDGPEPVVYGRVYEASYARLMADDLLFRNDWRQPDKHGEGSGYASMAALITDEKAIEDVLDRRILTFSTGQQSSSLRCNICGHDWVATKSPCEHYPGRVYEVEQDGKDPIKVKAYHVTGYLTYDHCAGVNSPADPHAVITGMQLLEDGSEFAELFRKIYSGPQDAMQTTVAALTLVDEKGPTILCLTDEQAKDVKSAVITVAGIELPTAPHPVPVGDAPSTEPKVDMKQENVMSGDLKKGDEPVEDVKKYPVTDASEDPSKDAKPDGDEPIVKPDGDAPKDGTPEGDNAPEGDNEPGDSEDVLSDGNILGSILEANIELDWVAMEAEGITEEEARRRVEAADKKLTTEARKKLSESTFCGPDRSFPVPDCSHAANAKTRLVHAKLSTDQKTKVLSCINRRAKTLGCFKSSKKKTDSQEPKPDLTVDEEVKQLKKDDAKMKQHIEKLKASLTAKAGEVRTILDALSDMEEKYRMLLASDIMESRRMLNKPRSTFDDDEQRHQALDELAVRPLDYLEGAFEDLKEEQGVPSDRGIIEDPTVQLSDELDPPKPVKTEPKTPQDRELDEFLGK